MRVVFITNGNSGIGFGHISRTLMLYSFLKKVSQSVKIIVPDTCPFIVNEDFIKVKTLSESELSFIEREFDVVIIDSIENDFDKLSWLANTKLFIVSITLFLFDFTKRYEHVSFFPSIQKAAIVNIGKTQIYSGNKYLTFRKEFNASKFNVSEKANRVLITMGGTDPHGLSLQVVTALVKDNSLSLTVLLSENANDYNELYKIANLYPNISLIDFVDDMVEVFTNHDVVVINGGLTRYETCVVGIPFIAISIHQKQFEITQELVDLGVGINLGVYNKIADNYIYDTVKALLDDEVLRSETSLRMRKLIDTKGVERICIITAAKFHEYEGNNKMG